MGYKGLNLRTPLPYKDKELPLPFLPSKKADKTLFTTTPVQLSFYMLSQVPFNVDSPTLLDVTSKILLEQGKLPYSHAHFFTFKEILEQDNHNTSLCLTVKTQVS